MPVILAGGSGTRLWPLSREVYPKQFLRIGGENTLLQQTALRAAQVPGVTAPVVICGEAHRFLVAEQLREIGVNHASIILEPEGRNTAPAAAVAALFAQQQHGDDALVFLMSADHAVADVPAFCQAASLAAEAAAGDQRIVVFGIRATRPETGYGYLARGDETRNGVYRLERFVEKPDAEAAEKFLADGGYDWNGGLFLFPAALFLDELRSIEPDMLHACSAALLQARTDLDFIRLDAEAFKRARNESIDYAVMEQTDKADLVPMDAGWDDVGSWSYLDALPKNDGTSYTHGDVMLHNAENLLVHAESRLVTALGVADLVIVETDDAVLVTTPDQSQNVRTIVSALRKANRDEANTHPTVHRPWGTYRTVALGERFQVKRIVVQPGQKLSSQMHHHRAEHWIVVSGTAKVNCDGKDMLLSENQSTYIPLGGVHRLENPGKVALELIEVQSGSYLGEDDIVRFSDAYGRIE